MKRLLWDAEVSPNAVLSWRIGRKITLGYENIVSERKIICIAYKWEDQKTVHALHWDDKQDDRKLLLAFNEILNSCDEAVAHYGDGFDWPWFRARCLINGIPTNHLLKTVDTCKLARKLYMNSFKLDYLGQILGVGKKIETTQGLWRKVLLDKSTSALSEMIRYNKADVLLLESVYHKLQAISPAKTHLGVTQGLGKWSCPTCASKEVKTSKTRITARGSKSYQMQCKKGHYFSIGEKTHQDYLKR